MCAPRLSTLQGLEEELEDECSSHWVPRSNHPAVRLRDCPLQTVGAAICIVGGLINPKYY